jgi:hypothetical protein
MALKDTVKTLEEVDEAFRPLYVADKEVGFKLDVEGREDPAELRRAKQRESEGRKAAEKRIADMEAAQVAKDEEARKAKEDAAKKAGDVDSLQKSWQEKYDKDVAAEREKYVPQLTAMEKDLQRVMIDRNATEIAAAIALPGSEKVLFPHIRSRLRIEMRDGERVTVVVDPEGKASALTLDELKKEFLADKGFAPMLTASRASGGGANGGKGGGATDSKTMLRADFERMDPAARSAFIVKNRGTVIDPS